MLIVDITRTRDQEDETCSPHTFDIIVRALGNSPNVSSQKSTAVSIPPFRSDLLLLEEVLEWHRDRLTAHIGDMLRALQLCDILPVSSSTHDETLIIRVAEEPPLKDEVFVDPAPRVLWELLERRDAWDPSMRPSSVCVLQAVAGDNIDQSDPNDGNNCSKNNDDRPANMGVSLSGDDDEHKTPRKMLVMACRAPGVNENEYLDEPPTQPISRTVLAAAGALNNIETPGAAEKDPNNIKFVRPGSFVALQTELKSHPQGYFSTIHLDMEVRKVVQKNKKPTKIYFRFVRASKNQPHIVKADLKTATEVGQLLASHGVRDAVLVPCPLARSVAEAVAAALIRAGMHTVVAWTYSTASKNIESFISRLYTIYLHHNVDLAEAAWKARRYLRPQAEREGDSEGSSAEKEADLKIEDSGDKDASKDDDPQGPFSGGDESDEDDSELSNSEKDQESKVSIGQDFMPLIFIDKQRIVPAHPTRGYVDEEKDQPHQHEVGYDNNSESLHGREIDILHIESTLLLGERLPLLLYGPPGVGKTALLSHVCAWWKASGMIDESVHLHLSAIERFDKSEMLHRLQVHFTQDDQASPGPLFDYLARSRCLIILDGLDCCDLNSQYAKFSSLCSALNKAGAIVVVASRRREKWLSKGTKTYGLTGLHNLLATEMLTDLTVSNCTANDHTLLSRLAREIVNNWKSESADGIIELFEGNPLAMLLLARMGICRTTPTKANLALLGFSSRENRHKSFAFPATVLSPAARPETHRSLQQLDAVFSSLRPTRLGEGFSPLLLSPFIGGIPFNDLITLLYFWSTRVRRQLGEEGSMRCNSMLLNQMDSSAFLEGSNGIVPDAIPVVKSMLNEASAATSKHSSASDLDRRSDDIDTSGDSLASGVVFWEDVEFPEQPEGVTAFLEAMSDRFKKALVQAGVLEELPKALDTPAGSNPGVMKLNPLVPLFWKLETNCTRGIPSLSSTIREAFVLYYCYRGKRWPWGSWSSRGSRTSRYADQRWADAHAEIELEFDNFSSACVTGLCVIDEDTTQLRALLRIAAVLGGGTGDSKYYYRQHVVYEVWQLAVLRIHVVVTKLEATKTSTNDGHRTEELYMLLLAAIYFISQMGRYREINRDLGQKEIDCRKWIAKYAMWASARIPDVPVVEGGASLASSPVQARQALQAVIQLAATWDSQFRFDICNYVEEQLFDRTANPFLAGHPPTSWKERPASLDIDFVAMLSFSAECGVSAQLTEDAIAAAQNGNWDKATELLDTALGLSLNTSEENSCANRARLLSLQAMIAERQNNPEKAQRLKEEQARLEDLAIGAKEREAGRGVGVLPCF